MSISVHSRRWTRAEYETLIDKGVFHPDERVELVGGELMVREPQGSRHAVAATLAEDALRAAFGPDSVVLADKPVALDEESEPEPDVAVAPGPARRYLAAHPSRPVLVVEVADSSLGYDRERKGSLHARAGLIEYWIVNLVDEQLEVYRDPAPAPVARFRWRYGTVHLLGRAAFIAPLAAPLARIAVADFLP